MDSPSVIPTNAAPLVALDRITPDPEQPRKNFPEGPLQELADRIWIQGLIQPITLTPGTDGGPDVILVGECRFRAFGLNRQRALRLLDENPELPSDHPAHWYSTWTAIPALHRAPMSPDVRLMLQIAENDERNDLSLYERALAVHKALQLSGKSGKAFALEHGLDPTVVSGYKVLVNSKGPTKAALEQGLLRSIEAARLFMRLPADRQEFLIDDATEKESILTRPMLAKIVTEVDRVQEIKNKIKDAGAPEKAASKTTEPEPFAPDAPVMALETLCWLEQWLRPEGNSESEPRRADAHSVLHQALLQSAAFIVISEAPLGEPRSPNQQINA